MYAIKTLVSILLLVIAAHVCAKEEKTLYPSGKIQTLRTYAGNQLHGPSKEYYENGNIKMESYYNRDVLESQKKYRADAQIEYDFLLKGNKKYEALREYHPSGKLFRERQLIDGIQEGLERDYYPDGNVKAERNYKNGKKQGSAKGYYKTGKIQGDWEFKNGVPVAATIFYPSGEKHLVHGFKDGRIHGITLEYDKAGKLIAKRYYEEDKLVKRVRE